MESYIKYQTEFERKVQELVMNRWNNDYPQYFKICNAINLKVHSESIQGAYKIYLLYACGQLADNRFKWTDSYKSLYCESLVYEDRELALYEIQHTNDIRIWCLENMIPIGKV